MRTKTYSSLNYIRGMARITIITECQNCGQLFSGKIDTKADDFEGLAKESRKKVPKCPVCGKKVFQKQEYSVWSSEINATDALTKQLREQIHQFELEESRAAVEKTIAGIEPEADLPVNNEMVSRIKSDISSLKAYLHQLIDAEIWVRFLEGQIVSIDKEIKRTGKASVYRKGSDQNRAKREIDKQAKKLRDEISALQQQFADTQWVNRVEPVEIRKPFPPRYKREEAPERPVEPVLKQPGLFNKKKILAENEQLQKDYSKACELYAKKLQSFEAVKCENATLRTQYEKAMEKYYEDVAAEDRRVKEETRRLKKEGANKKEEAQKELDRKIAELNQKIEDLKNGGTIEAKKNYTEIVLKKEKEECLKILKKLCTVRNKLFSINVIYPNYRDLSALSSFYEYFNSERCYELEGPNGAYNLYEAERRSDSFASVIRTLEDIKKNQVVLYRELSNMFENRKKLESLLEKAEKIIVKKEDGDAEISQEFASKTFKEYFAESKAFRQQIEKSIDGALAYFA